jgi:hypothetical protein
MKVYCIDSIELSRCKRTSETILKSITKCDICHKIPIPPYKSNKHGNSAFCRTCFFNQNYKFEDINHSNQIEMNKLDKLLLSCQYKECNSVFNIDSLKDMLEHEKICVNKKVI